MCKGTSICSAPAIFQPLAKEIGRLVKFHAFHWFRHIGSEYLNNISYIDKECHWRALLKIVKNGWNKKYFKKNRHTGTYFQLNPVLCKRNILKMYPQTSLPTSWPRECIESPKGWQVCKSARATGLVAILAVDKQPSRTLWPSCWK